jgi:hypothetical protein
MPFTTPPLSSHSEEAGSPNKKLASSITPPIHSSPRGPPSTPQTLARYGIPFSAASRITKKAANLKTLIATISELMTWGIQREGQYTDLELGNNLKLLFDDVNVKPNVDFNLNFRVNSENIHN